MDVSSSYLRQVLQTNVQVSQRKTLWIGVAALRTWGEETLGAPWGQDSKAGNRQSISLVIQAKPSMQSGSDLQRSEDALSLSTGMRKLFQASAVGNPLGPKSQCAFTVNNIR